VFDPAALRFHRLGRQRGSGQFHVGMATFYLRILRSVIAPDRRRSFSKAAVWILWLIAHTAGFCRELALTRTGLASWKRA
jgi:hypothetical protein